MRKLPYSTCWWCGRRFTAGGKYAVRVMLPEGPVFVHVACEEATADSRTRPTAAPADHVPTQDELDTAHEDDTPELEQFDLGR